MCIHDENPLLSRLPCIQFVTQLSGPRSWKNVWELKMQQGSVQNNSWQSHCSHQHPFPHLWSVLVLTKLSRKGLTYGIINDQSCSLSLQLLNKTVKQSLYRLAQALMVPRGWDFHISKQSVHEGGKVLSLTNQSPLPPTPGNIPGTHFC